MSDKHPAPWRWTPIKAEYEMIGFKKGDEIPGQFFLVDARGEDVIFGCDCDADREFRYVEVDDPVVRELIRLAPEMEALLRKLEYAGSKDSYGDPVDCCPECKATAGFGQMNPGDGHTKDCELGRILAALDAERNTEGQ